VGHGLAVEIAGGGHRGRKRLPAVKEVDNGRKGVQSGDNGR